MAAYKYQPFSGIFFTKAEETALTSQPGSYILPKLHTMAQVKIHMAEPFPDNLGNDWKKVSEKSIFLHQAYRYIAMHAFINRPHGHRRELES